MNYNIFLYSILLSVTSAGCTTSTTADNQHAGTSPLSVKECLQHPLGTLLKMEVEVFDGDLTNRKEYMGVYLFKIKTVANKQMTDTLLMTFRDETGRFPTHDFALYKYLYGKEAGSISSTQADEMKKGYVGKVFNIVAYETGEFTGIPKGYSEYQGEKASPEFHFQNYLVVVADLTKGN